MIRKIIVALVRLALRIYFQRIEVTGVERVPLDTPVIFVLNHPNALVDPVFLLCLAPRDVSFLAKAPLFRMPVIGYLVKQLDSLPVYRRQDEGEDVTKNQETFIAARKLLARGGTQRERPCRTHARRAFGPASRSARRGESLPRRRLAHGARRLLGGVRGAGRTVAAGCLPDARLPEAFLHARRRGLSIRDVPRAPRAPRFRLSNVSRAARSPLSAAIRSA